VKPLTPITGEVSGVLNRYAYYKNLRYDSVMLSLSASPFVRVLRRTFGCTAVTLLVRPSFAIAPEVA
jgi:hypothetical protein